MTKAHFRTDTAREGVAICDNKSKNTRIIARMVTCEKCRDIIRYCIDNEPETAKFFGWRKEMIDKWWR